MGSTSKELLAGIDAAANGDFAAMDALTDKIVPPAPLTREETWVIENRIRDDLQTLYDRVIKPKSEDWSHDGANGYMFASAQLRFTLARDACTQLFIAIMSVQGAMWRPRYMRPARDPNDFDHGEG